MPETINRKGEVTVDKSAPLARVAVLCGVAAAIATAGAAKADQATIQSGQLEEVIVTAQKREQ